MGVLPLEFVNSENRISLKLNGNEKISLSGITELYPGKLLECKIDGEKTKIINLKCRIDTNKELEYYKAGGILEFCFK